MKKIVVLLCTIVFTILLMACNKEEVSSSVGSDETELNAVEIYEEMLEKVNSHKYVAMYCATTDSTLNVISSAELYGDLEKDEYTSIYADNESETMFMTKLKQDVNDYKKSAKYIASDYGWVEYEAEETDDYRSIFTTFFDFVSKDNLEIDDNYTVEDASVDYSQYYILEEAAQSEDGTFIYYTCIFISKDTMLPIYVNVQTYDKSKSSDKELTPETIDDMSNYTNILVSSKTYQLGFYDDLTTEEGKFYAEANSMPAEEEIITKKEFDELYWKANGENNEQSEQQD